ncbi:2OG-Fe(II) oxygenase [Alteromonas oceanisediminis]|uniref:2OG-Fe(II) oxygenase n=1 Tax=Alteromonas oceanisediminis TaxID=2836180 RepID=UPI001BD99EED|nr:2OG-Fe(II) oxygenase [Alteromonas oceanisediminis]MBT0586034.1 2OG-Fe(II) oxygenase [Alteromonas oceanisediminis]
MTTEHQRLFNAIVDDLHRTGYSIQRNALPNELAEQLFHYATLAANEQFVAAGVGRGAKRLMDMSIRSDVIQWIDESHPVGPHWLAWVEPLLVAVNEQLYMGLRGFESHFAHYRPGAFYQRHKDAFQGDKNRVLSLVVYLNPHWQEGNGGELVIYADDNDLTGQKVPPIMGTAVVFLSDSFAHEVLPTNTSRFSIAGWLRAT